MARASYLGSARAMALGTPPLAWFCAATWPVFAPPLTGFLPIYHVTPIRGDDQDAYRNGCSGSAMSVVHVRR